MTNRSLEDLDQDWVLLMRRYSAYFYAAAGLLALLGLTGWVFHLPFLYSLLPSLPAMTFHTSLCLILASVAGAQRLYLERWAKTGTAVSALVALVSFTVFAEHLLGANWIVPAMMKLGLPEEIGVAGRMSVITASVLALYSLGSIGLRSVRFREAAQILVSVGLMAVGVGLIGYVFGVASMRDFYPYNSLAVSTSMALWLIGLAELFVQPTFGFLQPFASKFIGGWALRRFFVTSSLVIVGVSWFITKGVNLGYYDAKVAVCIRLVSTLGLLLAVMLKVGRWMNLLDLNRARVFGELEANEKDTRKILESMPHKIWMSDAAGHVTYANHLWLEYTGMDLRRDSGQWEEHMVHPEDLSALRSTRAKAMAEGVAYEAEYRLRGSDGNFRWHLRRAVPLAANGGRDSRWLATCTDVEEKHRLLEERAAVRIREAAVEESARLKSEFVLNMSHEIRTPLNGVLGMAELLQQTTLSEHQGEVVKSLRASAESLSSLVNDVLDLGKIEQGKMELERLGFDLGNLLAGIGDAFRFQAESKGITLSLKKPPTGEVVMGDPTRLRQVLANFISNAIRFTERGGVTLACARGVNDPSIFRFEVIDSGIGIPASARDKIFSPFSQVDSSTTRRYGGSGLGLKICNEIAKLMGGAVGFESVEGKGSKFWLEIPLVRAGAATAAEGESKPLRRLAFSRSPRVLVVEDHEINQRVAQLFLERLGCTVKVVADGLAAVKAVGEDPPDLLLMDCQMPVMDGYTATQEIRFRGGNFPIIALTGNAVTGERERCVAAGMDDYLTKPIRGEELRETLIRWLGDGYVPQVLREIANTPGGDEATRELVRLFRKNVPNRIAEIQSAFHRHDVTTVAREAHALKSASAYVGAEKLSELCTILELADHPERLHVDGLAREFTAFSSRLRSLNL